MSQSHKEVPAVLLEASERKSGRAAFDEDGRTVWEWQTATGVFSRFVTDEQMSRLEASNLRLVESSPSQDAGVAIYGSKQVGRSFASGSTPPTVQSVGPLRQFWRRLVPST